MYLGKYISIPIVKQLIQFSLNLVFTLFRTAFRKKSVTATVMIVSLNKIGDTVLTIPAVKAVSNYYQSYKKVIIVLPASEDIYKAFCPEFEILVLESGMFSLEGRIANREARKIVKTAKAEIIYDLTGDINSATLLITSNARVIYGFTREFYKKLLDVYVPKRCEPHLYEMYLDGVQSIIDSKAGESYFTFEINYDPTSPIIIAPMAGWRAKEWLIGNFLELAILLSKNFNIIILIDRLDIKAEIEKKYDLSGIKVVLAETIKELIKILSKASLVIANDSGPVHIASAKGIPTFSIYGPTNPNFSKPVGTKHKIILNSIECMPKIKQYCAFEGGITCPEYKCMLGLPKERVFTEVNDFIEELKIINKHDAK